MEMILFTIYILGILIICGITAYGYGKATGKERESNGFILIPFASLVWPMAIIIFPIVILMSWLINIGEKSKGHKETP